MSTTNISIDVQEETPFRCTVTVGDHRGRVWVWILVFNRQNRIIGSHNGPIIGAIPRQYNINAVMSNGETHTIQKRHIRRRPKSKSNTGDRMRFNVSNNTARKFSARKPTPLHTIAPQASIPPPLIPPPPPYAPGMEGEVMRQFAILRKYRYDNSFRGIIAYGKARNYLRKFIPEAMIDARI